MNINKLISNFDSRTLFFYLLVGGTSAFVYFVVFTLFWKWFDVNYKISVSIGYVLSVVTHFTANRRFTYQSHDKKLHTQLPKYLSVVLLNYLITLFIVHGMVSTLHLSPYFGIVVSIGITLLIGYLMTKHWVFKKTEVFPL